MSATYESLSKSPGKLRMEKAKEYLVDSSFLFIFGQKPQPLLAVEEFSQAANLLLMEKNYEEYVFCQEKAGELHREMGSNFLAGKNFKDAAGVALKLNNHKKACELHKTASDEFMTCGSYDKAAEELERAAIVYTSIDFDKAYGFYQDAMSLLEREDHLAPGLEIFRRCLTFTLAANKLLESVQVSTRLQDAMFTIKVGTNFQRQVLTTVIIQLAVGDENGALKTWNDGCSRDPGLDNSEEGKAIQDLLQGFNSHNQDIFNSVVEKCKVIEYLDVAVLRLAKTIKVLEQKNDLRDLRDEIEEEGYL